ncbi:hypothetical protein D0O09_28485 [Pseudomonas putida]|nr:hypothetical protein D0O09_28485 [Pseudomonas putida]
MKRRRPENYDVVIASPDAMRVVGQLGQVLGPRGLMPKPESWYRDPRRSRRRQRNAKAGQVRYRTDKETVSSTPPLARSALKAGKAERKTLKALIADLKAYQSQLPRKGIYVKARYPEHHHGPRSGHRSELAERVRNMVAPTCRATSKIGVPAWRGLSKTVGGAKP